METICIPKKQYEELKKKSQVDIELVKKIRRGLEDIKCGRIREWKD